MKSYPALPRGYTLYASIDLVRNKKQFWIVNGLSLVLSVAVLLLMSLCGPSLFDAESGGSLGDTLIRLGAALAGLLAYVILHELTHGAMMKACGASVHYGFKLAYAYAGSDAYFTRRAYIVIALAPAVLWGIIFTVLLICLPEGWFWVVGLWQMMNIAGAAGDFYCTYRILRAPRDTLTHDNGTAMNFFTKPQ